MYISKIYLKQKTMKGDCSVFPMTPKKQQIPKKQKQKQKNYVDCLAS